MWQKRPAQRWLRELASVAVIHDGRVMPWEVYGQGMLSRISGPESSATATFPSASEFLLLRYIDPQQVFQTPLLGLSSEQVEAELQSWGLASSPYAVEQLLPFLSKISELAAPLYTRVGPAESDWERGILDLHQRLYLFHRNGVPPAYLKADTLNSLQEAYQSSDSERLYLLASQLRNSSYGHLDAKPLLLQVELYYHWVQPLKVAFWAYVAACVLGVAWVYLFRSGSSPLIITTLFWALCFHVCDLAFQVLLFARPPVTDMPSSLCFVAAILSIAQMLLSRRSFFPRLHLLATGAIIFLLLLSFWVRDAAGGEHALAAVLDSPFWLIVHVLTICLSYAMVLLASLAAVLQLSIMCRAEPHTGLARFISGSLRIGVLLVLCGTFLGAIWADYAWGCFWSWDPKENGALLIALWGAMVLHLPQQQWKRPALYYALVALSNIPVGFAWLGVNAMGAGLHSYGFFSCSQAYLHVWTGCQVMIIILAIIGNHAQRSHGTVLQPA